MKSNLHKFVMPSIISRQILSSSIASDYDLRHFFMDLILLADETGKVDMTAEAIARETTLSLELVSQYLDRLAQPDPQSRNPANEGRRIKLLDTHRNWGWQLLNHSAFNTDVGKKKAAERAKRYRERKKQSKPKPINGAAQPKLAMALPPRKPPTLEEVLLQAAKIGLPEPEAKKFFHHFNSNGWRVGGKAPMKSYPSAMMSWKSRWWERAHPTPAPRAPGTSNL